MHFFVLLSPNFSICILMCSYIKLIPVIYKNSFIIFLHLAWAKKESNPKLLLILTHPFGRV